MLARLAQMAFGAALLALVAAAAWPLADRQLERARLRGELAVLARLVSRGLPATGPCGASLRRELAARLDRLEPALASWESIGGCGVGGGGPSSAGGGTKWVGRKVTGGLVDVECIAGTTFLADGTASVVNLRPSADLTQKWNAGVNLPFLYKVQGVDVFGEKKTARIAGWGDLGLDVTRKLGITNASRVTLQLSVPTGSHDAVRQGVVLPQRAQLGAGKVGGAASFEHTFDELWGMALVGGSLAYGGGENDIGDFRSSSASGYAYAGYLLGPFVPSVGLSLTGKFARDRERREPLADQSLYTGNLHLGLEWSNDWVAVLLAGSSSWSVEKGPESWTLALGTSLSLF